MSQEEVDRIKKLFLDLNLHPIYLEHKEVITSEDAAKTRGFELKQGIKAIVLTNGKGDFAVADVPADKKANVKKIAESCGWSKSSIGMATENEVLEKTGCKIGAVPPFGHKEKLKIFVDKGIYGNEMSTFNIGLRTISVKIPTKEMKVVFEHVDAVEGEFAKTD